VDATGWDPRLADDVTAPSALTDTDAGAERLPDFAFGWRSFGARAPSLFEISGPFAREHEQSCFVTSSALRI